MKKMRISVCSVIVVLAICSFFGANNSAQKRTDDLSMSNIEALHASAGGEMKCDQKNDAECKIVVPTDDDIIVGRSTGYLIYNW